MERVDAEKRSNNHFERHTHVRVLRLRPRPIGKAGFCKLYLYLTPSSKMFKKIVIRAMNQTPDLELGMEKHGT